MTTGTAPTVQLAGITLTNLSPDAAANHLALEARAGRALDVHLVNAYTVSLVDTDRQLREVITGAGLNFADGKPLTWAARGIAKHDLWQVRGPGLFERTLATGHRHKLRHFLLGGSEETLTSLRSAIALRHPSAEIVGWLSPPFRPLSDAERAEQDAMIRNSGANIVWVGLGTPKQDFEAARLARDVGVTAIAVGAAFDFSAGTLRQAPEWMGHLGLEWLFRFAMEPRRLWRRYTVGNLRFVRALFVARRHHHRT